MPDDDDVSFRDDLKEAFAAAATPAEDAAAEPAAEDEPAEDAAPEAAEAAPEAEAEPADDGVDTSDHEEHDQAIADGVQDAMAKAAVQAPEHWPAEDRDFLAALPDDAARERVLNWRKQIERGAQQKFEESASARRLAAEITETFKPLERELALAGMTTGAAVRKLVAAEMHLRQDPAAGLEWLASQYGGRAGAGTAQAQEVVQRIAAALKVDIGAQANGQAATPPDPATVRIQALEAKLAQQERSAQEAYQRQVQEAVSAADTTIRAFAEAKDASGRPAYPHFETVKSDMGRLIQAAKESGGQLSMEDAYQNAMWSRPDLREALLKAQRDDAGRKAAVASQAAVAKAKAAQTPRTTSARIPPPNEDDLPQVELLRRAMRTQSATP
jgi:hypothetical protein